MLAKRGALKAWIGFIIGTDAMRAFGYDGKSGALEAWIGCIIGTDVLLAFGYDGKTGALVAWIGVIIGTDVMLAFSLSHLGRFLAHRARSPAKRDAALFNESDKILVEMRSLRTNAY